MSLPWRVESAAQVDFFEAYKWYAAIRADLADQFEAELHRCFSLAANHPLQYPAVTNDIRRIRVRHHPYNVYFQAGPMELVVVAIMHTRRSPDSWLHRII